MKNKNFIVDHGKKRALSAITVNMLIVFYKLVASQKYRT
jgi:hypothetical protein